MGTNLEKLASEYLRSKQAADAMAARAKELKNILSKAVEERGDEDDKGHLWMNAGRYLLQRQKRQSAPFFNKGAAEKWAKDNGLWDSLKKTTVIEEVHEDDLVAYVFQNPEFESALRDLYTVPEPTWAFMSPQEVDQYDV
jgi:hypothetical protein